MEVNRIMMIFLVVMLILKCENTGMFEWYMSIKGVKGNQSIILLICINFTQYLHSDRGDQLSQTVLKFQLL